MKAWQLASAATTAGIVAFVWGLVQGGSPAEVTCTVHAWPRSPDAYASRYAVQIFRLDGDDSAPVVHQHFECSTNESPSRRLGESVDTDESGWVMLAGNGYGLEARTCYADGLGTLTIDAQEAAPIGEPVREPAPTARTHGGPTVYLESAELAIDTPSLAWLDGFPSERAGSSGVSGGLPAEVSAYGLELHPEPGLDARVLAACEDGVVLELTAHHHVADLNLSWSTPTPTTIAVGLRVSRGGPRVQVTHNETSAFASVIGPTGEVSTQGWLGLFDAHGLLDASTPSGAPWPLPPLREDAVLVAQRGSFRDSVATTAPISPRAESTCERGARLRDPRPTIRAPILLASPLERAREARAQRARRGRNIASLGLSFGWLGLLAVALRSWLRPDPSGALRGTLLAIALGVTTLLYGVLLWLLYV